jgi:hypothetical protein
VPEMLTAQQLAECRRLLADANWSPGFGGAGDWRRTYRDVVRKLLDHIQAQEKNLQAIALAEFAYWRDAAGDNPDVLLLQTGAMGAAANIVSAVAMGTSADDYRREVASRDRKEPVGAL